MSLVPELVKQIVARNALQASFLNKILSDGTLADDDRAELDRYLEHSQKDGVSLAELADSYDLIVKDTLREQMFFKRHKHYRFSRYEEVAASVYLNPEYMSRYMRGLALTAFLWPNHVAIRRYFLTALPRENQGGYLEIGPGHGFYLAAAMRSGRFSSYEGIDLSPTSIALTERILSSGAFGDFSDYVLRQADFLESALDHSYDMIVMGEVLEHVEQPQKFLRKIRVALSTRGRAFVTTCLNSPASDHIYLFRSVHELESLVKSAGLQIVERLVLPYAGSTLETSEREQLPVNVAFVLST